MRYLLRILNHFKPKEIPKPVGRWNNDCNIKTNKKIDFQIKITVDHVVTIY